MKRSSENISVSADLARDAINAGKKLRITVDSLSMTTRAMMGDVYIFVAAVKAIRPGDIVLAEISETLLTHRVVKVDKRKGILLKGDARIGFDGYFQPENIIAVCNRIEIGEERYIDLNKQEQRIRAGLVVRVSLFYGTLYSWFNLFSKRLSILLFFPFYLSYRLIINVVYPRFRRR